MITVERWRVHEDFELATYLPDERAFRTIFPEADMDRLLSAAAAVHKAPKELRK
jgi:hypothetical protein